MSRITNVTSPPGKVEEMDAVCACGATGRGGCGARLENPSRMDKKKRKKERKEAQKKSRTPGEPSRGVAQSEMSPF